MATEKRSKRIRLK